MSKFWWLLIVAVILLFAGYFFIGKGAVINQKASFDCVLVLWNPENRVMKLNCDGKSYEIRAGNKIFLTTYEKNATGQEYEDVVVENGKGWSTAYCVNDKITVVLSTPANKIEQINIREIRNRGPRYCKWLNS